MGPNDVELVRAFTRDVGGTIGDMTFPANAPFEIAVDAEVGNALHVVNPNYTCGVVVRDLTAYATIPATAQVGNPATGAMGMAGAWPAQAHRFVFDVAAASTAALNGHICEVIAYLTVGQDVSFVTSPRFIIAP